MESVKQNKEPQISIILNTRNRCKLLSRSINSALNQTFKDFELIVVNGASTDDTKEVVETFLKKDNRVRYLFIRENKNAAYCINLGFKIAKGEFIAILDDDDEFLPTKLEKQIALMKAGDQGLGIVYCWEEFWDDKHNKFIKYGKETSRGKLYNKLLKGPCTGGGTLMLIRKTAVEKAGGYDETIAFGADYQFNLNISKYFSHDYVPEVLVKTHWNHEYVNLTTQKKGSINHSAVIEYYEKILADNKDGFELVPQARLWHYKSLISSATHMHNYRLAFHYFKLGIKTKAAFAKKTGFIYVSLKRIVISLF